VIEVLLDHHLGGYAPLFAAAIAALQLEGLLEVRFVIFSEVALPIDSDDRTVWRFAQARGMIILTANRNDDDDNSLGRTLLQENTSRSLPILTIGRVDRLSNVQYRERCVLRLLEIVLDLDSYLGTGRLFLP
jgi:hypothetical protein